MANAEGGLDLVVALSASPAERVGAVSVSCTSLGGTAVAVLEVQLAHTIQGLVELLTGHLSSLLARSSDWTQRLQLAYPDGSLLPNPVDPSLTLEDLLGSEDWRHAEARASEEGDLSSASMTPSRSSVRKESKSKLEGNLRKLQEAKNLPLTSRKPVQQTAVPSPSEDVLLQQSSLAAGSDPASWKAGGRVLLVSSLDLAYPVENVLDGNEATYWLSTGLYPQEILLELGRPSGVAGVRFSATNVRGVRIEGCSEQAAMQFETLAAAELEASAGRLQRKELRCREQAAPTRFVKMMILSGWHDFCSVHRIVVVE